MYKEPMDKWITTLVPEEVYRKNLETAAAIYKDYSTVIDRAGLGSRNKKKLKQVIDEYTTVKWMYACREEWLLLVLAAVTSFFVKAFKTQIRYSPSAFKEHITYEYLCRHMDCVDLLRPAEKREILEEAGFDLEKEAYSGGPVINYMDIIRRYRAA